MGFLAGSQESAECKRAPRGILHQPGEVRSSPGSPSPGEGRGAHSPSPPRSGESLSGTRGGVCHLPVWDFGGMWSQLCSMPELRQRGWGVGLPGKVLGQQQDSVPTRGGGIRPLLSTFPLAASISPRVSCQASVSWCPSLAPAYVSVGKAGSGAGQPERLCCPQGPPARHQVTLGRGHGRQSGAPQHPAPHPGSGDLLVASQPRTVAGRCCAPWQGDTVHCGTEQGCKFSADGGCLLGAAPTGPCPPVPWSLAVPLAGLQGSWQPQGHTGCSSHPVPLRCSWLNWPAHGWGHACRCRKWGCIQPREGLKWHFWRGRGTTGPDMLYCAPAEAVPAAQHAGGCSASWDGRPKPPHQNTVCLGSRPGVTGSLLLAQGCGLSMSHPSPSQREGSPQPHARTGSLRQEPWGTWWSQGVGAVAIQPPPCR